MEGAMSVAIFLERCERGDARSRERGAVAESATSKVVTESGITIAVNEVQP